MPIKIGERHITGVGDRDVIAHGAAGQCLGVAPLGDGHTQVGGLVVVAHLDDLAGIFQCFIESLAADLPVGRRSYLDDFIPAQGQGFGGGDAPGVRGDIIDHFSAAGLADFVHSPLGVPAWVPVTSLYSAAYL